MSGRAVTADIAKGATIVLVVLHHAIYWCAGAGYESAAWMGATTVLSNVRMPLFFVLAGYFARNALNRPWREIVRPRLMSPWYAALLWTVVIVAMGYPQDLPMMRFFGATDSNVWQFRIAAFWFLVVLPLYFVGARLTARLPVVVVVVGSLAAAEAVELLPLGRFVFYGAFFVIGARLPVTGSLLEACARHRAALAIGCLIAVGIPTVTTWPVMPAPLMAPVAIFGILGSLSLASYVAQAGAGRWFAATVGRRTLAVYILQGALIAALARMPISVGGWPPLVLSVLPALVTAAIVAMALGLEQLIQRLGATWILRLPPAAVRTSPTPGKSVGTARATNTEHLIAD